ncbi:ubiquinone biosynthesis accessory factor UbiJ [Solimonas soli]|uniref:ubiquinone biosynthesis accessory factor UbiJ n=1 Tax=Solimonas soli TaxID=413479 RepID=UPI000485DCB6|nr:SCP2 sterol-binding domain-containing protein [Solimonas soli]
MSAPAMLNAALEVALNRYLALEPEVLRECAALSGRCVALAVEAPAWTFALEFHAGGVRVLEPGTLQPDVTVRGGLTTLMRLAWTVSRKDGAAAGAIPQGLSVDGDVELLRRFNGLLARVGFDPEEFAARFVGDAAAHRLNQGLQTLFGWGRRSVDTLALDTAEFLREETRDLARADDVAAWGEAVETLRDGVERLEARLRRLEAQAEPGA